MSVRYRVERGRTYLYRIFLRIVAYAGRARLGQRLPVLRLVYFAAIGRLRPGATSVGQWKVCFHRGDNAVSHSLRNVGTYEPLEVEIIQRLLRAGDCAVDVGANIGLHTLAMSDACGPGGKVMALEPDPDNLRLLARNIRLNHCGNVEVVPVAASDRAQTLYLYLSSTNLGDHRVYDPGGQRSCVAVRAERLDALLGERHLRPVLMKVDVQGWEPRVLAGILPLIRDCKRFILVTEFWTDGLAAAGSSAQEYVAMIDDLRLDLYEIDEVGWLITPVPADRRTLLDVPRETNLIGVRGVPAEALWTTRPFEACMAHPRGRGQDRPGRSKRAARRL